MPSNLPVELFERILEDVDILDILRLKLLHRQAYRVICCSNRIKYRLELFLAGVEDGNHYSLAERQLFLRSYLSNWDNLTPQRITTIRIPNHHIYELAGGVYGLIPTSSPNTMRFYRLPSVSRRIEMEEWSVSDLDFSIDDFAMECAYDLLTVFTYKTGHVKTHLLKLSDGKPHPRAKEPLLKYDIPLNPTENGWQIEAVIWENRLGCLFTSASRSESVDSLAVWDWKTGDLLRVLSQCGNCSFMFLNDDTIVAGRTTEDGRPSLAFFDLVSDEKTVTPSLTFAFPDADVEAGVSWRIRLNLGAPIRHGPELRLRVPFVVNPSQQMLFIVASTMGSDNLVTSHSIAIPLSKLQDWSRETMSFTEWEDWEHSTMPIFAWDPHRATFTMGSRFVDFAPFNEPTFDDEPEILHFVVHNLNPHRLMRVGWDSSRPHCQDVPGVWNVVTPVSENGSRRRPVEILTASTLDVFMTEDNLVVLETDTTAHPKHQLRVLSF